MDASDFERWKQLKRDLELSAGWHFRDERLRLSTTLYILNKNFADLRSLLRGLDDPKTAIALLAESARPALESFIREVTRLLHNYLASVMSTVDHTRNMANDLYADNPFMTVYKAKVAAHFAESNLHHFMQELRNEMLHNKLLMLPVNTTIKPDSLDSRFTLPIERLKTVEWKSRARTFVDAIQDELRLEALLDAYHAHVTEFHKWLAAEQEVLHKADFEEMQSILRQIIKLEGGPEGS